MTPGSDRTESSTTWTIDELAHLARVPSRTIREYQRLGVLPPPQRSGRTGLYDQFHLDRLKLIARLQERGYSLAGIADLIAAWSNGETLDAVLGHSGVDEAADGYTHDELLLAAPWIKPKRAFLAATRAGLIRKGHDGRWYVRAPSLLRLVADAIDAGAPVAVAISTAAEVRDGARAQAAALTDILLDHLWDGATDQQRVDVGRRSRVNAAQAAASLIIDELATAILARADATNDPIVAEQYREFVKRMSVRRHDPLNETARPR